MVDVNKLLGQFLGSGTGGGFAGGMAGGLLSSVLAGKAGRKLGGSAVKMGGLAAIGALAYTAYQRYNDQQKNQPGQTAAPTNLTAAPAGSPFMPRESDTAATEELGLTLVRAMIAAARSDGRLDAEESQAIFQKIQSLGLDQETQSVLVDEMSHPVDMDAIVKRATTPEVAAEIYTASLLAVEVDSAAEKGYLAMLAARLRLPPQLVTEIERQVEEQKKLVQSGG